MKIAVIGASGRMGQAVMTELAEQQLSCSAAIVAAGSKHVGKTVTQFAEQGLCFSDGSDLSAAEVDVFIDFSLPEALAHNLTLAQRLGAAIVVCTTGLTDAQRALITEAAQSVPVLYAANTSVGICVMEQLVALASAALPAADVEIVEAHHQAKRDAPSGTALVLAAAAANGRGEQLAKLNAGLRGAGQRRAGSIGFAVVRAADIIGEHQVLLAQPGERIELTHRVGDRKVFARGAVQAAQWLASQPTGYYGMRDMLDMKATLQRLIHEI
ncbi:4-hydroxy-tetrahydrodipicolinate reductase [Pseudidiomarina halophila]|uniref:4-hydroxy-tetrahydrodipicolinate reductase n=1 Tax=Pseudidiomarina halophila TaxID=1449799 RepID=A0A432XZG6_9GAMM|nr:4-hydroxy-tetrahydrodipicolinate reductase [Pseudidiomarina halophila]RUO54109.1 4-hydroxy-tetrahydrodipicolinate reductase [Pseudidiomarina halophila]